MKNLKHFYLELEKKGKIIDKPEYKNLVNFSTNLDKPIHRWFDIKEGYSRDLIINLINRFDVRKKELILDPFCGSGTTLLAAKEKGIDGIGFEINPFLAFLTKVKLNNYTNKDILGLELAFKKIEKMESKKSLISSPKLSISKKLFGPRLKTILAIKEYISRVPKNQIKDLLNICFLSILEDCSTSKKDGNGLKYPRNKIPKKVRPTFIEKLNQIIDDLKSTKNWRNKSFVFENDVRKLEDILKNKIDSTATDLLNGFNINNFNTFKEKVSLVVFSPPYMNCFDYTEVYKVELWFGDFIKNYGELKNLREATLSSHLNQTLTERKKLDNEYVKIFTEAIGEKELWNKKIPFMIQGYFEDMWLVLKGIYRLLAPKSHCVIVVGNSAYGNIVIPTDLILGDLGLDIGFKSFKVEVARHLGTSSQQYKKVNARDKLRESLVILKK